MMKKHASLLFVLALIAGLIIGCGSGGGGGGGANPVASEAENGLVRATLHGFLAAVQSSNPQAALSFCSPRLQTAPGSTLLLVTDLIGKKYEFTVPADGYTYLTSDLAIVKAYHERIENYRVELIFTLAREGGTWFIDDMEMRSTPIPPSLSFFVETVKAGPTSIGTDKSSPVSLTTPTPTFEVLFNSDPVNLDTATWAVKITDQNTSAMLSNATSPTQFSILPSGSRAVLITVGNTPDTLQNGSLYALEFSSPALKNASGTPLATPVARYFTVLWQQGTQAPIVQGISAGMYNTDQTFTITAEAGKTYSYSLDNGTSWLTYSGPVTLSTDGTYTVVTRENVSGQTPAPLSMGISLTIDKTPPQVPTVSGITAGTFTVAQTMRVTGAEAGGTLYYSLDNGTTPVVFASDVTVTNPGTYQIVAWQVDAAGNAGARSAAIAMTINTTQPADTTAPLAPTVSGITAGTFTVAQTFRVTRAEAGGTLYYALDNGATPVVFTSDVTVANPGTYQIVAWQVDAAGNVGARSDSISITINSADTTAPLAPTVSGITAGTFTDAQTFRVTGAEAGGTLYYALDNGTTPVVFTSDVTVTNAGTYQIVAWQVDAAGNVGARSAAIELTITVPMAWSAGFPKTTDQGPFAARMAYQTSLAGTVKYVVLPSGAGAPSAAQVNAGTDASGALPVSSGSFPVSAGTQASATITGLALGTAYDIWSVAFSEAGSMVGPTKVTVTVPALFTKIKDPAEWPIRSRFTPVMFNDRMWVIGGGNGGIELPIALNDSWSSLDGISWTEESAGSDAPISMGRESHGTIVFNGSLWVMGGRRDSIGLLSNEIWNSSDGKNWTLAGTAADRWGGVGTDDGRRSFGLVSYRPSGGTEQLYLLGGFGGSANNLQNDVWSSSDGTAWASLGNAPWLSRESFGCAVFQEKIFVIGGNGANGCFPDIWSFDGTSWTQVTDGAPWGFRKEMKTAVVGDTLFAFGGRNSEDTLMNDLWYTRNGTDWTSVAGGFPGSARAEPGFVTDGFHLFILGGDSSGTMLNDVWRF